MKLTNICNNCQLLEMEMNVGRMEVVFSYEIPIASYYGNTWHRHWNGYSLTTLKHVNKSLRFSQSLTKKDWLNKPVEEIEFPTNF